ncbi:hypothetical protein [Pseudomonas sp. MWU13-3659]|uniref:hypothetical protein n=1 Tax=Pseudomonas sp. MWU13-3659 TaxID=2986964 RepID=UPI00207665EB|nr:hypothetical protein [Pseudomonas sp. MWU13-3659]
MKPRTPVLGVLGLCWVGLSNSTRVETPNFKASRTPVLGVLGSRARVRARDLFLMPRQLNKKTYARTQKPNKPNTLNTPIENALNSLGFICVGFVLGCWFLCWVLILEGCL